MAVRAEEFIRTALVRNGRLLVRYRDGEAAGEGKLDDYACYSLALLELYRVTFRTDYLDRAAGWADKMVEQFLDRERGGFFLNAKDAERLIVRTILPSSPVRRNGRRRWKDSLNTWRELWRDIPMDTAMRF